MKIGVFDSGIGGKSVADTLRKDYPEAEVLYVDDRKNVPYGSRSSSEIISLTDTAIQPLLQAGCDVIVLACNTATSAAIEVLRGRYPGVPFIGLEPMVKPASAMTHSGSIAVCATPATLRSSRYAQLKKEYTTGIEVLEPDCSDWAYCIERNEMNNLKIEKVVDDICRAGADVIVLACTHYHWIKKEIIELSNGRAVVIDPSDAISEQVGRVTARNASI